MTSDAIDYGITFDDVLLVPAFSEVIPADADVRTRLTRRISLNIPLLRLADGHCDRKRNGDCAGQRGWPGVIHKNMSIERQTEEVGKVKRSANGIIFDPVSLRPDARIRDASELMDQKNISGIPITDQDGRLAGIITRRDLRFLETQELKVAEVMTRDHLVTATGTVTLEEAEKILMANKVEKLLLV